MQAEFTQERRRPKARLRPGQPARTRTVHQRELRRRIFQANLGLFTADSELLPIPRLPSDLLVFNSQIASAAGSGCAGSTGPRPGGGPDSAGWDSRSRVPAPRAAVPPPPPPPALVPPSVAALRPP